MRAPLRLPASKPDLAVSRAIAAHATRRSERVTKALTWAADEHLTLAAATALWVYCHARGSDRRARRCANHVLTAATIAAAMPHLIKRLVDRRRPDRSVVGRKRHGIPLSGKAYDSFPSGHAVQVAALAAALSRVYPPLRWIAWPLGAGLAATRVLLLAHYASDVLAGLGIGVAVEAAVARVRRRWT